MTDARLVNVLALFAGEIAASRALIYVLVEVLTKHGDTNLPREIADHLSKYEGALADLRVLAGPDTFGLLFSEEHGANLSQQISEVTQKRLAQTAADFFDLADSIGGEGSGPPTIN